MFQRDICNLPASDSAGAAYTHPLVTKTGSSESKISRDSKHSTISSFSLSALMTSPITCSSSSSGRMQKKCRPKRRACQFDEDQENINPAVVCDSFTAANTSAGFGKPGTMCRPPVSKKRCSKETDFTKRKVSSIDHFLATECVNDVTQAESYTSLISENTGSSERYGNGRALSDVAIKFALNHSDDRLHELIGDFSRPYCLPLIENDKHRDLKAISCHMVSIIGDLADHDIWCVIII